MTKQEILLKYLPDVKKTMLEIIIFVGNNSKYHEHFCLQLENLIIF